MRVDFYRHPQSLGNGRTQLLCLPLIFVIVCEDRTKHIHVDRVSGESAVIYQRRQRHQAPLSLLPACRMVVEQPSSPSERFASTITISSRLGMSCCRHGMSTQGSAAAGGLPLRLHAGCSRTYTLEL